MGKALICLSAIAVIASTTAKVLAAQPLAVPTPVSSLIASPTVPQYSTFNGVDISDLLTYFRSQIKTVTRETNVYHWRNTGGGTYFQQALTLHDPAAYLTVTRSAQSYWINYGGDAGPNVMGYGLYTSFEPAATDSYGGPDHWMMVQFTLPVGFRLVDLSPDFLPPFPPAIQQKIGQFDCTQISLEELFNAGLLTGNNKCAALVKAIFKDNLRIDGFIYSFDGDGHLCNSTPTASAHENALVITTNWWMTPDRIQSYFPTMTGSVVEREQMRDLINDDSLTASWPPSAQAVPPLGAVWQKTHLIGCGDDLPYK